MSPNEDVQNNDADAPTEPRPAPGSGMGWVGFVPAAIGLLASGLGGGGNGTGLATDLLDDGTASDAPAVVVDTEDDDAEEVMYAHFIDVGQADAALLEFPCAAILIDAGAQDDERISDLLGYLDRFFERRQDLNNTLESIVITHNHVDHTRALREVVERFTVNHLIENGQRGGYRLGDQDVIWVRENLTTNGRDMTAIDVDDDDVLGAEELSGYTSDDIDPISCATIDPTISILSADLGDDPGWGERAFENKNNHSIVVRIGFGEATFLFTGDLEEPAVETLVDYYADASTLDVDVFQVGHHGSYNGSTSSLMAATTPEIAVISMGPWTDQRLWTAWAYGHPRNVVVDLLRHSITRRRTPSQVHVATAVRKFRELRMRDAVFGTGWDGDVKIRATSTGRYRVTTGS